MKSYKIIVSLLLVIICLFVGATGFSEGFKGYMKINSDRNLFSDKAHTEIIGHFSEQSIAYAINNNGINGYELWFVSQNGNGESGFTKAYIVVAEPQVLTAEESAVLEQKLKEAEAHTVDGIPLTVLEVDPTPVVKDDGFGTIALEGKAMVKTNETNLRKGPGRTDYEIIKQLNKRTELVILGYVINNAGDKWYKVKETEEGSVGFIKADGIVLIEEKTLEAELFDFPALSASIAVNKKTATLGEKITWTITPSGGNGDYAYFFNIFCGNEVLQYGVWQLSPSISWTPQKAGNYFVSGYVVDSRWTEIKQGSLYDLCVVSNNYAPLQAMISVNKTTAKVGDKITWTINASGGNGDYGYFFNIFCGDEVLQYGSWQLSPSISWTATKNGNYYVSGYVVDSRWTEIKQGSLKTLCTVIATDLKANEVISNVENAKVGDEISWTASASGGNGKHVYNFLIYNGSTYVTESGWQVNNKYTYKPKSPGFYYSKCYVTDTTWTSTVSCIQNNVINVKKEALSVDNTYVTNTKPYANENVSFYVSAKGGTGTYAYQYVAYELKDGSYIYSWERNWDSSGSITIKFSEVGTTKVVCNVVDSEGSKCSFEFVIQCVSLAESVKITPKTTLPIVIDAYSGYTLETTSNVTGFTYEITYNTNDTCDATINLSGIKTYDRDGSSKSRECKIKWILYDENNNYVDSGIFVTKKVKNGETFGSDNPLTYILGLLPYKSYHIEFLDANF